MIFLSQNPGDELLDPYPESNPTYVGTAPFNVSAPMPGGGLDPYAPYSYQEQWQAQWDSQASLQQAADDLARISAETATRIALLEPPAPLPPETGYNIAVGEPSPGAGTGIGWWLVFGGLALVGLGVGGYVWMKRREQYEDAGATLVPA